MLKPGGLNPIGAYVDWNWGSAHVKNRRSRTGILVRYGNDTGHAVSKLQESVSLSSTEAEFRAIAKGYITVA